MNYLFFAGFYGLSLDETFLVFVHTVFTVEFQSRNYVSFQCFDNGATYNYGAVLVNAGYSGEHLV